MIDPCRDCMPIQKGVRYIAVLKISIAGNAMALAILIDLLIYASTEEGLMVKYENPIHLILIPLFYLYDLIVSIMLLIGGHSRNYVVCASWLFFGFTASAVFDYCMIFIFRFNEFLSKFQGLIVVLSILVIMFQCYEWTVVLAFTLQLREQRINPVVYRDNRESQESIMSIPNSVPVPNNSLVNSSGDNANAISSV